MKTVRGDLIKLAKKGEFDVIAHGCNCMCVMGAGIAKSIRGTWPQVYEADKSTIRGSKAKLGTCTIASEGDLIIVNAYTQYGWRGRNNADYDAIRKCMAWIAKQYSGRRIGLPKIGAGLAGGDWKLISSIIEDELGEEDVTIVEFSR